MNSDIDGGTPIVAFKDRDKAELVKELLELEKMKIIVTKEPLDV